MFESDLYTNISLIMNHVFSFSDIIVMCYEYFIVILYFPYCHMTVGDEKTLFNAEHG